MARKAASFLPLVRTIAKPHDETGAGLDGRDRPTEGDNPRDAAAEGPLQFAFNVEQKPGEGEDADPLLAVDEERAQGVLAVFDGMGGAGSTSYSVAERTHTGAYLASRIARSVVEQHFVAARAATDHDPDTRAVATTLKRQLTTAFRKVASELDPSEGRRLGGKLMRRLPTTMVCIVFRQGDGARVGFETYWAGDSRAYVLTPGLGLQQVSTDDLKSGGDAMQNLLDDSPISNCIDADTDFAINVVSGGIRPPAVFIAATDGCFNYGLSPAHFEHALLSGMADSLDSASWRDAVRERLSRIAGDDLSMAVAALGWRTFAAMKRAFTPRLAILTTQFVEPLSASDARLRQLAQQHRTAATSHEELRATLWHEYKQTYQMAGLTPQKDGRER